VTIGRERAHLLQITAHLIQEFMRERLAGKWRAGGQKRAAKPLRSGTVNRELDTLKSILSSMERGKLIDSQAREIKRLTVANRRTRILTRNEQRSEPAFARAT
jgi:hypothetical protein